MPTPHNSAAAGDFCQDGAHARRPAAREVHSRKLSDRRQARQQRPRRAGLHGLLEGRARLRPGQRHGHPSIGIYSWELYNQYGVENIIRVGSAGGIADELQLRDVVAAVGACTDSTLPTSSS